MSPRQKQPFSKHPLPEWNETFLKHPLPQNWVERKNNHSAIQTSLANAVLNFHLLNIIQNTILPFASVFICNTTLYRKPVMQLNSLQHLDDIEIHPET